MPAVTVLCDFAAPVESISPNRAMRRQIRDIETLSEREFRSLEFELVSRYRRSDDDQEWIAVELTRKNLQAMDPLGRYRVDEILAMLAHVHDPLISALSS